MKSKLTLLAISTALLLSACGNDKVEPAKNSDPKVAVEKAPEVKVETPKEPEFSFDWEEPKEPYYTLGLSPLDPIGLISRYKLDEKAQASTTWFMTEDNTAGFCPLKDVTTLYTHTNIYDEPEKADEKQSAALAALSKVEDGIGANCKKITEEMAFELKAEEFKSPLTVLKTVNNEKIQTWFFEHIKDGYFLISKRNIDKPKGFIYRCKADFVKDTLKPALTGITVNF